MEHKKIKKTNGNEQTYLRVPLVPVNWGHGRPWGGAQSPLFSFFPDDRYSLMDSFDGDKGSFPRQRFWQIFLENRAAILQKPRSKSGSPSVIAIIGVPMDVGVGYRHGARFGPRAIRDASAQFGSGVEGGFDIREVGKKIVDLGDIEIHPYLLSQKFFNEKTLNKVRKSYGEGGDVPPLGLGNFERIQYTLEWILGEKPVPDRTKNDRTEYEIIPKHKNPTLWKGNVFPVVLGGDHTLTLPCIRAMKKAYGGGGLGVICFDAHPDYLEKRSGLDETHASQGKRVAEEVGPENLFQIGLGYIESEERKNLDRDGVNYWRMDYLANKHADDFSDELCATLKAKGIKNIYISFDIDVLDASIAPGTGVPEPGGMTTRYLIDIIQNLGDFIEKQSDLKLVGLDLVEVAPDWDIGNITALAAVKIIFETLGAYFIPEKTKIRSPKSK